VSKGSKKSAVGRPQSTVGNWQLAVGKKENKKKKK